MPPQPQYQNAEREPIAGAWAVSTGAGSVLRIPVLSTNGLAIELRPRGYTPPTGSTSSLFIQDLSGKRHLRLDFGYNKNSKSVEWHWNQKGTHATFGISNHTSVGKAEQALGNASKLYRFAGRSLLVIGAATDAYSIVTSARPLRRSVQVVSGWSAAAGGCRVVGAGGAALGTATAGPGVGTAVGGILGCAAGAFIGYLTAERGSGYLYDWGEAAIFHALQHQADARPWAGGGGQFGGGGASGRW